VQPRIPGKIPPTPPIYKKESEAVLEESDRSDVRPRVRFDEVYRTFSGEVGGWIRALGAPDAEREDLRQDVFLIVHRRLSEFDGQNLSGWLFQITRRRVRDFRRLRWFRVFFGNLPIEDSIVSPLAGPEVLMHNKQHLEILDRLLSILPEHQRVAFVLFEIEGHSGEEIARLQHVPVNTVWARIHKARSKLAARATRLPGYR
jgi:RNA polymerase sigma-70 factor (ECF subfamily)